MNRSLFLLVFLFALISCNKIKRTPVCIQDKIYEFQENSICDSGSAVLEYDFQDKIVYVFEQGSCGADLSAAVLNSKCIILGNLGGFTGNSEINGEAFSNASFRRTIWKQ
jgi:hypothetical protein|tara:strand:+ start:10346 stop:10675 length:330 start_codon:yes stop_codon:yes gene_type:complete